MSIIFQTKFQNSLDTDFPDTAPHGANYRLISGRGIDYGNAYTCSSGPPTRTIAAYGGVNYTDITLRVQWGFIYTNNFIDSIDGISTRPGFGIFGWGDPLSLSTSSTGAFSGQLKARPNGMLTLYITGGGSFDSGRLVANSAVGVLIYDGRMHGIQLTLKLISHSSVIYNVVVNNVSVISGTFSVSATDLFACPGGQSIWMWPQNLAGDPICLERAAVTQFSIRGYHSTSFNAFETSVTEVQVEDTINVISYGPSNAINAIINPCSPYIPPIIPPTDKSGIYMITESTLTHDKYNVGEFKIPDPLIKTPLLGE